MPALFGSLAGLKSHSMVGNRSGRYCAARLALRILLVACGRGRPGTGGEFFTSGALL